MTLNICVLIIILILQAINGNYMLINVRNTQFAIFISFHIAYCPMPTATHVLNICFEFFRLFSAASISLFHSTRFELSLLVSKPEHCNSAFRHCILHLKCAWFKRCLVRQELLLLPVVLCLN